MIAPAETLARMANGVDATPDQLREVGRADAAEVLEGFHANVDKFVALAKKNREQSVHPMLNEGVQLQTIAETLSMMIDAMSASSVHQALMLDAADTLSRGASDVPGFPGVNSQESIALHQAADEAATGRRDLIESLRTQVVKLIATANPSNADEVIAIFTPILDRLEQMRARGGEGSPERSFDEPQSLEHRSWILGESEAPSMPDFVRAAVPARMIAAYEAAIDDIPKHTAAIPDATRRGEPVTSDMVGAVLRAIDNFDAAARDMVTRMQDLELHATQKQIDVALPLFEVGWEFSDDLIAFIDTLLPAAPNKEEITKLRKVQASLRSLSEFHHNAHDAWVESGRSSRPGASRVHSLTTAVEDDILGRKAPE